MNPNDKAFLGHALQLTADYFSNLNQIFQEHYGGPGKRGAGDGKKGGSKKTKDGTGRKTRTKDPNAPKKPVSGYILYHMSRREALQSKYPDLHVPELAKVVGREWTELPQSEKDAWKAKAIERQAKLQSGKTTTTTTTTPTDRSEAPDLHEGGSKKSQVNTADIYDETSSSGNSENDYSDSEGGSYKRSRSGSEESMDNRPRKSQKL
mmetsp:Transcript_35630/g.40469  ORF Transcript_35630/g.40469 Transcript_35630/m.40469 type:complete len:207 (-) Transcript_35630:651-1271(-)